MEPEGQVRLMGDASEEFLGDDDIGVMDSDCEGHDVLQVVGLDVAVAVEVPADDEVEVGVVDRELVEEAAGPTSPWV